MEKQVRKLISIFNLHSELEDYETIHNEIEKGSSSKVPTSDPDVCHRCSIGGAEHELHSCNYWSHAYLAADGSDKRDGV